jgi:hypothetical protein
MFKLWSTLVFCYVISDFTTRCKCWWHFKNIGNNDLMSYSWTIEFFCFWLIQNETNLRFWTLDLTLKITYYVFFFLHIFFKSREMKPKTTHTSFRILEANKVNSFTIPKSASIMLSKLGRFYNSSISFVFIVIIDCKTSLKNQCPWDWFNKNVVITREIISTTISTC